jgi:flagellar motor switch protein FliM
MAENSIAMSTVAALEPGQILPISLSRLVSLRVGEQTVGQGTLGKRDDQMAIQLKLFLKD